MFSIRRFLMIALLAVILGGGVLLGWATYRSLYHEMDEQYDAELVQSARLLAAFWQAGQIPDPAVVTLDEDEHRYRRYFIYQFWRHGELVLGSDGAPAQPLVDITPARAASGGRYRNQDGWHSYAMPLEGDRWVVVGESEHARRSLVRNVAGTVLAPYLLSVPVVILLVWLAVGRGLRPLTRLARSVAARDSGNLTPLRARPVRELAPLTDAINTLLSRLSGALEREKRFTADAAHELRTLLMVLRLHADNAAHLDDPEGVRASMAQLSRAVDRASRTVEQLLALARLDPQQLAGQGDTCDATDVARDTLALLASLAQQRDQRLVLATDQPLPVALPAEALQVLLRNLIDNACRYSPVGGRVEVGARAQPGAATVVFTITDEGAGLDDQEGARLTGRFSRGNEESSGAGLGLSIVDRLLRLYGGDLRFRVRDAGLPAAVILTLPAA
ncbi:ATP-binding protein [Alloalcanivorax mobilis]|uniref:ATP-binding protein n=1 Tax=Alloalcanivorax mobilis TaxID=2019569 RepID=UPI000C77F95A|nr:ATP-binding protein [Alloalcanivorax mobilis]